jgi:hypothetical protein
VLDGPTDVRGVYVPMTRGRLSHDAYIATHGDTTAAEVFAESLARSWIDRPALARQAELAGPQRRPGTLPAAELRALLARKADLTATNDRARSELSILPGEIAWARQTRDEIARRLAGEKDRLQGAFDALARHDRPLHRRGHEADIGNAKRTIAQLPGQMRTTVAELERANAKLARLEQRHATAHELAADQPARTTQLAQVTERLDADLAIRLRQVRHETPHHVAGTIGYRPTGRDGGRAWDRAAAQIDQHHAAYGTIPGRTTLDALTPARAREQPIRRRPMQHDGPHMGISM